MCLIGLVFENHWNWIQITFIYPLFWMYGRQSLLSHFLVSHFLIFSLRIFKVALFLISSGTIFHIFELNTFREFIPYWLALVEVLRNSVYHVRLYLISLCRIIMACTCNPGTLEANFRNDMVSIPVEGNSHSIVGWIVWPLVIYIYIYIFAKYIKITAFQTSSWKGKKQATKFLISNFKLQAAIFRQTLE